MKTQEVLMLETATHWGYFSLTEVFGWMWQVRVIRTNNRTTNTTRFRKTENPDMGAILKDRRKALTKLGTGRGAIVSPLCSRSIGAIHARATR